MDQISIVGGGALFFSLVAYWEARDILRSHFHRLSPTLARVGGVCAGVLTGGLGVFVYGMLTAAV